MAGIESLSNSHMFKACLLCTRQHRKSINAINRLLCFLLTALCINRSYFFLRTYSVWIQFFHVRLSVNKMAEYLMFGDRISPTPAFSSDFFRSSVCQSFFLSVLFLTCIPFHLIAPCHGISTFKTSSIILFFLSSRFNPFTSHFDGSYSQVLLLSSFVFSKVWFLCYFVTERYFYFLHFLILLPFLKIWTLWNIRQSCHSAAVNLEKKLPSYFPRLLKTKYCIDAVLKFTSVNCQRQQMALY